MDLYALSEKAGQILELGRLDGTLHIQVTTRRTVFDDIEISPELDTAQTGRTNVKPYSESSRIRHLSALAMESFHGAKKVLPQAFTFQRTVRVFAEHSQMSLERDR